MNRKLRINKVASYFIFAMALGTLVAGCGGGGNDAGTGTGAVLSYLADQQGGGFLGRWWYAASAVSVAKADENSLVANGTNQYTATTVHKMLSNGSNGTKAISGTWGPNSPPDVYWDLISSGWVQSPDTATLVDNGDGRNITMTLTGEPAFVAAVTKTSLANTPIACTSTAGTPMTCVAPGVYPAGAASYRLTVSYTSNQYELYGDTLAKPITDVGGTAVTALPALNATFCDPTFPLVFQSYPGSNYNYRVLSTTSCSSSDISAAITAAIVEGTIVINNEVTNNVQVASFLHVQ